MDTKQHYENHLAEFYSWMFGDFDQKLKENEEFFSKHKVFPAGNSIAIDLGSGSGLQSIPLAKLGFKVTAVDFSKRLLGELNSRKNKLDIKTIEADLMNFEKYLVQNAELVVCMGDTLTHLNLLNDVKRLFENSYKFLSQNGRFIISYRDLSFELKDESRFIPVRSTDDTIFTCFLEYENDFVKVHDIINRKINGKWEQKVSSYKKLRIPADKVRHLLEDTGFKINITENSNGLNFIICSRL